MIGPCRVGILSEIHYASAAEQARGDDYEAREGANPLLRLGLKIHRRFIWLHQPLRQNHRLHKFLTRTGGFDYLVANGDYSCDSGFVGVSDDAACQSARECLEKLREKLRRRVRATYGDP